MKTNRPGLQRRALSRLRRDRQRQGRQTQRSQPPAPRVATLWPRQVCRGVAEQKVPARTVSALGQPRVPPAGGRTSFRHRHSHRSLASARYSWAVTWVMSCGAREPAAVSKSSAARCHAGCCRRRSGRDWIRARASDSVFSSPGRPCSTTMRRASLRDQDRCMAP